MFPSVSPTSIAGQLESDIRQLQNEIRRKADDYKVSSLDSRLDAVVNAVRDISAVCDGILSRLEACEEELRMRNQ